MAFKEHDCLNHPGVPAAVHCAQCHKPICEDCIVETRDGSAFCSTKCFDFNQAFYDGYDDLQPRGRSWFGLAVGAVVVLAILVGLMYAGRALGFDICDEILKALGL